MQDIPEGPLLVLADPGGYDPAQYNFLGKGVVFEAVRPAIGPEFNERLWKTIERTSGPRAPGQRGQAGEVSLLPVPDGSNVLTIAKEFGPDVAVLGIQEETAISSTGEVTRINKVFRVGGREVGVPGYTGDDPRARGSLSGSVLTRLVPSSLVVRELTRHVSIREWQETGWSRYSVDVLGKPVRVEGGNLFADADRREHFIFSLDEVTVALQDIESKDLVTRLTSVRILQESDKAWLQDIPGVGVVGKIDNVAELVRVNGKYHLIVGPALAQNPENIPGVLKGEIARNDAEKAAMSVRNDLSNIDKDVTEKQKKTFDGWLWSKVGEFARMVVGKGGIEVIDLDRLGIDQSLAERFNGEESTQPPASFERREVVIPGTFGELAERQKLAASPVAETPRILDRKLAEVSSPLEMKNVYAPDLRSAGRMPEIPAGLSDEYRSPLSIFNDAVRNPVTTAGARRSD